jgi:hypothetical protein
MVNSSASDFITLPKKLLFLYPDYRVDFQPFEPRSLVLFVSSDAFIKYILDHNLFDTLYKNTDELKYFEFWLTDYQTTMSSGNLFLRNPVEKTVLDRLADKLQERKAMETADLNILFLQLANDAFENQSADKAARYLKQIQPVKLLNIFQYKIFNFVNNYSFELIAKAIAALAVTNQFDLAYSFANVFKKEVNRSSLYAYASELVSSRLQQPAIARRLLDSAITEMKRLDNPSVFQPNRQGVAIALMYADPEKNSDEAYRTIKNSSNKFTAIQRFSKSYAFHGNLYAAVQQLPPLVSTADKAAFFSKIVEGYNARQPVKAEWKKFNANQLIFTRMFLVYVNEN